MRSIGPVTKQKDQSLPPKRHCPQCEAEVRPDANTGEAPSFCQSCRFPIMLVAGKYRLLRVLGEGGFATVYEAHHVENTEDPRRVAKILKPELMAEPGMKARFNREVQVTSKLSQSSDHIVRIFPDFGELSNLGVFYVMEYLDGQPLSEIMAEGGLLPLPRCYHFFAQLCEAMQVAHENDVVHRDLKPENLFVIEHQQDPDWLKVIDFGIAKPVGSESAVTKITQGVVGTPAYMAPELYMNQPVGPHTDIYAMGIILFELLAGHTPFAPPHLPSPSAASFMASHIMEPAPSLLALLPEGRHVPADMEMVINQALAKKPEERFRTASEMRDALQAVLDGRPLPAGVGLVSQPELDAFDVARMQGAPDAEDDYDEIGEGTALDHGPIAPIDPLFAALSGDHPPEEATVIQGTPKPEGPSNVVVSSLGLATAPTLEGVNTPSSLMAVGAAFRQDLHDNHDNVLVEPFDDEDLVVHEEGTAISAPPGGFHMLSESPMTQEDLPAAGGVSMRPFPPPGVRGAEAPSPTSRTPAPENTSPLQWMLPLLVFFVAVGAGSWWLWSRDRSPVASLPATDAGSPRPLPGLPRARTPEHTTKAAKRPLVAPLPFHINQRRPAAKRALRPRRVRHRRPRSRGYRSFPCPRKGKHKWIYLTFGRRSPFHIKVKFGRGHASSGRIKRRRRGICVGVRSPKARIILSVRGSKAFELCSFTFSRFAPRGRVRFYKRKGEIQSLNPSRCLLRR